MKLREYQEKAVQGVIDAWKTARSCLLVLPTGCGKTVVFGEVIRRLIRGEIDTGDSPRRAMILAHREELINQAEDKVSSIALASVGVEMGPREAPRMFGELPQVVVSSVQTQITGRIDKFSPGEFSALVIDEAHHATAKSYVKCIDHYLRNPKCRLLGVTATPDRADRMALGSVFETVAYEYSVTNAIEDGWLVPVSQKLVRVGSLDYSSVSTCAGDFNQGELSEVLEEEANLHGIASPTIQICGSRRAIIFATSVKQAERLAEIINRSSPGKAEWLCGKTDKDRRRDILQRFREGMIQFVVNVGVLTEGFDDAGVEVVVMARPTKSRALYAQMAGRATRPAAEIAEKLGEVSSMGHGAGTPEAIADKLGEVNSMGQGAGTPESPSVARRALIANSAKPRCLIIDFVGNSGRHKLITAVDILGGEELDPDEEEAREIVRRRCEESEEGLDTLKEIEETRKQIAARKAEEAKRRAFIQLKAKYTTVSVDPFNLFDIAPIPPELRSALDRRMLSFKQKRLIREVIGVDPDTLPTSQGKALIDAYFGRRERGLSTLRQTRLLRRNGIMYPMTFEEASATIGRILSERRS